MQQISVKVDSVVHRSVIDPRGLREQALCLLPRRSIDREHSEIINNTVHHETWESLTDNIDNYRQFVDTWETITDISWQIVDNYKQFVDRFEIITDNLLTD